ncbi:MAG: SurA N-terminal domain-containing protein [Rhodobacteraceae bacterium]|nr:SurA N-terminal domain-containing protein [Paracoccaceae bacterium]
MLEWLRGAASSLVAKLLLGLLVASFAAWGVGDMLRSSGASTVAQVGDREIGVADFQREFQIELSRYGNLSAEQGRNVGLDQAVLRRMAAQAALDQEAKAIGVDVSDDNVNDYIRNTPAFQNAAGAFDELAFDMTLRNANIRRGEYYEIVRRDLARQTLVTAIEAGGLYPRASASAIWVDLNETRDVSLITLAESDAETPPAPSDQDLKAFHQEEAERFTAPEYRTITYIWLRAEDYAKPEDVDEDEIADAYDSALDRYQKPERRNIERIDFDTQEEAAAAAARVADGESFEKVAADRGRSPADIALGYITRDELFDDASRDAAFGDQTSGVVGPVETDFGWMLFNIAGLRPAEETTLEAARDELAQEVALGRAGAELPDVANTVEDQRAGGATLLQIGAEEGALARQVTLNRDGFAPDGERVADLPDDPNLLERAFEMEIGDEMDLAELPNLEYFAVQVDEVTPAALKPFDSVRSDVEAAWITAQRRAAIAETADSLVARLEAGDTLAAVAASVEKEPRKIEKLSLTSADEDLTPQVLEQLFDGASGDIAAAELANGARRVIAVVDKIHTAVAADGAEEIELVAARAGENIRNDILALFQTAVLEEHEMQINPVGLNYATGAAHGDAYGGM